jgi:hypothetical protein
VTPVIRRRLAQVARDLKARRVDAAAAALDDAEAVYWAHAAAIRQERVRDDAAEARRWRAQKREWSEKGRSELQSEKAPEREHIVRVGRMLRGLPQFAGPRKLTAIAVEIRARDKTETIAVAVQQIRRILSRAGV